MKKNTLFLLLKVIAFCLVLCIVFYYVAIPFIDPYDHRAYEWSRSMAEERENALVSYCVKPAPGSKKRNCYVFLIDAKSHKLYFYASHKASDKNCGFTSSDMNFIYGFKKK